MNKRLLHKLKSVRSIATGAMDRVNGMLDRRLGITEYFSPAQEPPRREPLIVSDPGLDENFRTLAFTFTVIALGAKLAAADGEIRQEEFEAFCSIFPMPDQERPKLQRLFFMAKSDPNSCQHYARQLAGLFPGRPSLADELVRRLCRLAEADGRATLSEKTMLMEIADAMQVERGVVAESLASAFASHKRNDPYALLGVATGASAAEIKQAYRSRMRELHPDSLMHKDYSKQDIDHVQAELMAVKEAYQAISRKRKIK